MANKVIAYALPVAVGWVAAVGLLSMARNSQASIKTPETNDIATPASGLRGKVSLLGADNRELWSMVMASEDEHNAKLKLSAAQIDLQDKQRTDRVRKMYQAGQIVTAKDYYNGAIILQTGHSSADLILAHDMAVLALSKGLQRATWLTAETEDKYLLSLGKPQRFATQYKENGTGFPKLYDVDPTVTDTHRIAVGAFTLSEAGHRTSTHTFSD